MSSDSSSDSLSDHKRNLKKQRKAEKKYWIAKQEKERERARIKRKKFEEFERIFEREQNQKYEQAMQHKKAMQNHHHRSSSSESSQTSVESALARIRFKITRSPILMPKLGTRPFFKGPDEASIVDPEVLRKIIVSIHRTIPVSQAVKQEEVAEPDVFDPDKCIITRKDEEGNKPLFDREELKSSLVAPLEFKKRKRKSTKVSKKRIKRYRPSLSPPAGYRSPSPCACSSNGSRPYVPHRSRHYSDDSRESSWEELKKYKKSRKRRSPSRSYSKERDHYKPDYSRNDDDYEEYRSKRKKYRDGSYDSYEQRGGSPNGSYESYERRKKYDDDYSGDEYDYDDRKTWDVKKRPPNHKYPPHHRFGGRPRIMRPGRGRGYNPMGHRGNGPHMRRPMYRGRFPMRPPYGPRGHAPFGPRGHPPGGPPPGGPPPGGPPPPSGPSS